MLVITNDSEEILRKQYEQCGNCNHFNATYEKLNILEYQLGLQPQVKDALCNLDNKITHAEDWCGKWEGDDYYIETNNSDDDNDDFPPALKMPGEILSNNNNTTEI